MELSLDTQFASLDRTIPDADDYALARRHAPRIRFDTREPFLPLAVGYTVFRENGHSPSFPRSITLPPNAAYGVEYAIWWDWDIQHLYELEHIWVYLDASEAVVSADASWHGGQHAMLDANGAVPLEDGRVTLFSEAGKHAFAPLVDWLIERKPETVASCGAHSGRMGVLVTPLFEGIIDARRPLNNNVVHAYLERQAFLPSYDFSQHFDLANAVFVPWEQLFRWIPARVRWWADSLRATTPPDQRRPLRIAHRGASAYAQEGSRASVQKAAQLGADMIEVDVRTTADDVPVIAHDSNVLRVFGVEGSIGTLTYAELIALTPPDRQPILTFAEMTDLCASLGLGLYLDIKEVTPTAMTQVIAALKERGMLQLCDLRLVSPGRDRRDQGERARHGDVDPVRLDLRRSGGAGGSGRCGLRPSLLGTLRVAVVAADRRVAGAGARRRFGYRLLARGAPRRDRRAERAGRRRHLLRSAGTAAARGNRAGHNGDGWRPAPAGRRNLE